MTTPDNTQGHDDQVVRLTPRQIRDLAAVVFIVAGVLGVITTVSVAAFRRDVLLGCFVLSIFTLIAGAALGLRLRPGDTDDLPGTG